MKAAWLDTKERITRHRVGAEGVHHQRVGTTQDQYLPVLSEFEYTEYHESVLAPGLPDFEKRSGKVVREHCHSYPEARLCLEGEGIFEIRSTGDRMMRLTVEAGDLIIIPSRRYHRFYLTEKGYSRHVLFSKVRGEDGTVVPHYRDEAESKQERPQYERYVQYEAVAALLPDEAKRTTSDELLFYVSHLSAVLWLEVLRDDVSRAVALIEQDRVLEAADLLERASMIERVLAQELRLVERVPPHEYATIRHNVAVGSGGDAPGFKALLQVGDAVRPALEGLLARRQVRAEEVVRQPEQHYDLHVLLRAVLDLDESIQSWRWAHYLLMERHLGPGAKSLRGRPINELLAQAQAKQAPEVWSAIARYASSQQAPEAAAGGGTSNGG
ncbi:MAG: cupin domain-containing protein [Myxococcales bacterium]|nr:cupin domain-containing protein [Myxococcales bacterium]